MKRNTSDVVEFELIEDFVGGEEAEDSARPVVEGVLDGGELSLGDGAEVHVFGQVIADEAIGILIGAALPRAGGSQKKTSMYSRLAKVSC